MVEFDIASTRTVAPTVSLYNPCIYHPENCSEEMF